MTRILVLIGVLGPLTLAGCDSGADKTPKTQAVTTAPAVQAPAPSSEPPAPVVTIAPAPSAQSAPATQSPAEARQTLDTTRDLMNQTMAYMEQNRFDLAERNLQALKAKRDSLPEYLQIQVDRLETLVKTGAVSEPQRSLKAAIMDSQQQQ